MNRRGLWSGCAFGAGLIVAIALAAPGVALACACCDGRTEQTPTGWSATGDAILVRESGRGGCEEIDRLFLWHAGRDTPTPATEKSVELFSVPAEAVAPDRLRLETTSRASGILKVRVHLRTGDGWVRIWEGEAKQVDFHSPAEDSSSPVPLSLALWVPPKGDHALLAIRNDRVGEDWTTSLRWVDFGASRRAALAETPPPLPGPTHEVFGTAGDVTEPWLNLRKTASGDGQLVGELRDGDRVLQVGRKGPWWWVEVTSGSARGNYGFAHSRWLRPLSNAQ